MPSTRARRSLPRRRGHLRDGLRPHPEGLPYHFTLTADEAAFLQRVAWQTVEAWRRGEPSGSAVAARTRPSPNCPTFRGRDGSESSARGPPARPSRWMGSGRIATWWASAGSMSDPRVDGIYTNTFNSQCLATSSSYPGEMCLFSGTHVRRSGGGSDCTYEGSDDPTGRNWGLLQGACPGTGGFAGLTSSFTTCSVVPATSATGPRTTASSTRARPGEPWPLPSE